MRLAWERPDLPPGRRVAVTGLGLLSSVGNGLDAFWSGLSSPAPEGELRVRGFDPSDFFGPKDARRIDRFAQFSIATALMAAEDAGDVAGDPDRSGVVFASGVGGLGTLEQQIEVFLNRGARRISPFLVPMMMANAGAAGISMRLGWRGPSETVVTACAAGTHAIAAGARLVATGRCDTVVAGGAEAAMTPVGLAAFTNMTALSPTGVSRPFDRRRDGFRAAEGAAALILEDADRARARGARIYGLVAGAASTSDAHHITAPAPGGGGALTCMQLALDDAGIAPGDVAQVNAHGTSTPLNDRAEAEAIAKLFGSPGPPVTSIKGATGHALGAAGALEAVAVLLSIAHRVIPPTIGFSERDPEIAIDVVAGAPRPWAPGPTLSSSFGFGGHNGCLVLVPPDDR